MVIAATIGGYSINIDPNNDSTEPTNTKRVYKITNASGANIFIEGKETSTGTSLVLDAEDDDIGDLVNLLDSNKNGIIESNEAQNGGIQRIDGISLIDNHAYRSQVTQKYEASGVRFKWASPKKTLFGNIKGGTLDFADDIVSVGTDNSGNILTFICPRVTQPFVSLLGTSISFSGEVEIGQVAGKIDPVTGNGTIYLDDVNFNFWGTVTTKKLIGRGRGTTSISESLPATAPVLSGNNKGSLIVLDNIAPGAYAGQDPSKIFSSYLVNASVGAWPSQPLGQTLLLNAVNGFTHPGLLDQGTSLQWNIDLKSAITVNGL
jgi:hypothetical protein